jgi:transcriptional regulator with XRE-family HTH domain
MDSPSPAAVKAARLAAGLTQEEAGAAVGVARRTWQDWERGQRRMPPGLFELFNLKRTAS